MKQLSRTAKGVPIWIRVRIGLLAMGLLVALGFVVRRAYELQILRGRELGAMAQEQYLRDIRLAPKRGTIYDRNGVELAVSVDVESVWCNPRLLRSAGRDPLHAAAALATVLPIDVAQIAQRLASDRHFVWIRRHVTPTQASAVRALSLPGVSMSREARRFYPNRELAANVLGFANVDGEGIEGLELSLDARLRGTVEAVSAVRDRRGAVVFSEQLLDDRASQGDDVVLTIDKAIQVSAERELALAVQTFEGRGGSIVVLDPMTAEVLAMASYPLFNPNDPSSAPAQHHRNRAVTDRFEPGSTIKPFTVAAALTMGTIRASQMIDCGNGRMTVDQFTIHDSHAFDVLSPAQVLSYSSNIGVSRIGNSLGRRGLYRALRRFGFGEATGLPLPGEAGGILRHYDRWYEMDFATIPFGQGMSVTNMQMAVAMAAIANGGRLMRPILVRRVSDAEGNTLEETLPAVQRQVLPPDVARLVADMLTAVTGPGGTGEEASIDGYLVAGKTGTAQKADYVAGGYAEDQWLASFVGFVPVDRPRLVISIVIDEPVVAHHGGVVAAPVFRRVGAVALRHLGVPPTRATVNASRGQIASVAPSPVPPRLSDATALLPVVTSGPVGVGEARVPDLRGEPARRALATAMEASFRPELEGSGVVMHQDLPPGSVASIGARLRLVLAPPVTVFEDGDVADPREHPAPLAQVAVP